MPVWNASAGEWDCMPFYGMSLPAPGGKFTLIPKAQPSPSPSPKSEPRGMFSQPLSSPFIVREPEVSPFRIREEVPAEMMPVEPLKSLKSLQSKSVDDVKPQVHYTPAAVHSTVEIGPGLHAFPISVEKAGELDEELPREKLEELFGPLLPGKVIHVAGGRYILT